MSLYEREIAAKVAEQRALVAECLAEILAEAVVPWRKGELDAETAMERVYAAVDHLPRFVT